MAVGVIFIFNIIRILIIVLQDASYVNPSGYCMGHSDMCEVTPITQYIGVTLYSSTVIIQITFSVSNAILLCTLSKSNNSSQASNSHECLLKIAGIVSSVSLASGVIYNLTYYLIGEYSILVGSCVLLGERCTILCMLLKHK